jgi:hypothetical protein
VADRHFVVGSVYRLEAIEERSATSHRQYFAAVNEAWKNLPDDAAAQFPTPDHLRKFALIRCGYRDERSIACSSRAEAVRVAAFVQSMDNFAVVIPIGNVVTVYTAKSQSMRAMDRKTFQESADRVLAYVAELIGAAAKDRREG